MSAAEQMAALDERMAANLRRRQNLDIYTDYLEAGGFRDLDSWLTRRFTENDFTCWPSRQAGHQAERDFQPLGETE
jgi:hypothetical protein